MRFPLAGPAIAVMVLAALSGCGAHGGEGAGSCPAPGSRSRPEVDFAAVKTIEELSKIIAAIAGVKIEVRLSLNPQANAFAWSKNDQNHIAMTTGLLQLVGENRDEYAFVIAHEIAHLADHHIQQQEQNQAELNEKSGVLGFALDLVGMGFGVPLGGMISSVAVDTGSHLAARRYDRDQERRADLLGLQYMIKAGCNPAGAVSFLEKLRGASRESVLPLLSTHPGGEERIKNVTAKIKELAPPTPKEWPEEKEKGN